MRCPLRPDGSRSSAAPGSVLVSSPSSVSSRCHWRPLHHVPAKLPGRGFADGYIRVTDASRVLATTNASRKLIANKYRLIICRALTGRKRPIPIAIGRCLLAGPKWGRKKRAGLLNCPSHQPITSCSQSRREREGRIDLSRGVKTAHLGLLTSGTGRIADRHTHERAEAVAAAQSIEFEWLPKRRAGSRSSVRQLTAARFRRRPVIDCHLETALSDCWDYHRWVICAD